MRRTRRHAYSDAIISIFSICIILLSGCSSTINPAPFNEFQTSSESLRDGADAVMNVVIPQTLARHKVRAQTDDLAEIPEMHRLTLKKDMDLTFDKVPNYLIHDQFKVGLWEMNNAMVGYTTMLQGLVNKQVLTKGQFEALVNEFNGSAFSAYVALKDDASSTAAENTGLLAAGATGLFETYIKHQKEKDLIAALEINQPIVDDFSTKMVEGLSIIEVALEKEYADSSLHLQEQLINEDRVNRARIVESWITLNRDYFGHIQSLKALNKAAIAFPNAHKELVSAVKTPGKPLANAIAMVSYAKQLKSIADGAQRANKQILLERELLPIESQAVLLEAGANKAEHAYALAQVDAVSARIASDADPQNVEKKIRADKLEQEALTLKAASEEKSAVAQKMREAVDAVKLTSSNILE